jgi:23S rRNA (pseudouridine1915-N3)-methyltransferase
MLKIRIIVIGEHKDKWVSEACEHYTKLISRFAHIDLSPISSPKGISSLPPVQIMQKEGERLAKELTRKPIIALSDKGKKLDSFAFAEFIQTMENKSGGNITFVIGGPYGLSRNILDQADHTISLSSLTFSHQIARIVLLEQLYRAYTIIKGTGYHK